MKPKKRLKIPQLSDCKKEKTKISEEDLKVVPLKNYRDDAYREITKKPIIIKKKRHEVLRIQQVKELVNSSGENTPQNKTTTQNPINQKNIGSFLKKAVDLKPILRNQINLGLILCRDKSQLLSTIGSFYSKHQPKKFSPHHTVEINACPINSSSYGRYRAKKPIDNNRVLHKYIINFDTNTLTSKSIRLKPNNISRGSRNRVKSYRSSYLFYSNTDVPKSRLKNTHYIHNRPLIERTTKNSSRRYPKRFITQIFNLSALPVVRKKRVFNSYAGSINDLEKVGSNMGRLLKRGLSKSKKIYMNKGLFNINTTSFHNL